MNDTFGHVQWMKSTNKSTRIFFSFFFFWVLGLSCNTYSSNLSLTSIFLPPRNTFAIPIFFISFHPLIICPGGGFMFLRRRLFYSEEA